MTEMRAAQYDAYGPPEVLHTARVPLPEPGPGQALVRVAASSVNAADVDVRAGKLRLLSGRRFPRGTGFDFAGEVTAVAPDVSQFQGGDSVWGFLPGLRTGPSGAAAEYVVAPVAALAIGPTTIDAVGAAALSGAGAAALGVLRDAARLEPGERVLVRGGAGGVGSAAVQIAHRMGADVSATAGAQHLDQILALGADEAHDYRTPDVTSLGRYDVIVDPVGRDLQAYRRLLAPGGRMVSMNVHGPAGFLYLAASAVHGSRRVRLVRMPATGKLLADLATLIDSGGVAPVIDRVYPLDDIAAAHRSVEAGGGFGKRVIVLD